MKYSDLLGEWLIELGYTHCFFVAGGGIMHLLDGFRNRFECIPVVHEMSAGICAEHFNECTMDDRRAFALVTTGPGLTNIVTAIAGCYVEHRELLVIAGQVKSTDLLTYPERQRGVQEVDGEAICRPISVLSKCLKSPVSRNEFQGLVNSSRAPHPGPVVIEVCLDVQGASVDPVKLNDAAGCCSFELALKEDDVSYISKLLNSASRPLVLFGGLLSRAAAWNSLSKFEALGLPVATTTSAIDRVPTSSPVFAGRSGTWGGQRAGNLIVAQADVVIALGAQLDLQQTGFNCAEFAPNAKLVHVFPSQIELDRVGPPAANKILANPDEMLKAMLPKVNWEDVDGWGSYVRKVRELAPALEPQNLENESKFINSFRFLTNLSRASQPSDILALCSSGGTFTAALQSYEVSDHQVATTSAAHASMGYGLATAIGASFAEPTRRVILTEGEGGFSQNLQELAVVKRFALPIKIFVVENSGYASIRATQKKFFNGAYLGCDQDTGLGFPDWEKLFSAYGIQCRFLSSAETNIDTLKELLMQNDGPEAWIVRVDPEQKNWPSVSTILAADGSLTSAPIYDMNPKLDKEVMDIIGRYLPGNKL